MVASLLGRAASIAVVLGFVLAPAARAIPSPDVVISLFASAAQVLGVTTVILGRWFFVRRGQGRGGLRAQGSNFAIPFFVSGGLLLAALAGWGCSTCTCRTSGWRACSSTSCGRRSRTASSSATST
jgi:hypothetical protein